MLKWNFIQNKSQCERSNENMIKQLALIEDNISMSDLLQIEKEISKTTVLSDSWNVKQTGDFQKKIWWFVS